MKKRSRLRSETDLEEIRMAVLTQILLSTRLLSREDLYQLLDSRATPHYVRTSLSELIEKGQIKSRRILSPKTRRTVRVYFYTPYPPTQLDPNVF